MRARTAPPPASRRALAAWSNAFTVIMQDAPLPDGAADDPDAPANRFENFGDSLLVCFRLSLGGARDLARSRARARAHVPAAG